MITGLPGLEPISSHMDMLNTGLRDANMQLTELVEVHLNT